MYQVVQSLVVMDRNFWVVWGLNMLVGVVQGTTEAAGVAGHHQQAAGVGDLQHQHQIHGRIHTALNV
jgi:hypothetical protein